jgi:hypothetical protein
MAVRKKILLQTTIPYVEDDWHIGRFSKLHEHLASIKDDGGSPLLDVVARNREEDANGNEVILSKLDETDFDQLWLFAVDTGNGLSVRDCEAITRFRRRGGGIFSTRDHQDLGISLCTLGGIGAAHHFHSRNPESDEDRRQRDDNENLDIDFPNYHSGRNGDPQRITPAEPLHELLQRPNGDAIEFLPAHPHEGSVGVPEGNESARVIATGKSLTTGRDFNLIVAFEKAIDRSGHPVGRAIAESSFHHLVDYNWDPRLGCPTFLTESPGSGYIDDPSALDDVRQYVTNLARWLSD